MDGQSKWTRARLLVVGGGGLAILGFFMPWLTVLGFMELSGAQIASMDFNDQTYSSFQQASGEEETGNGALLWLVPACGALIVLVGWSKRGSLFGLVLIAGCVGLLFVAPFVVLTATEPFVEIGGGLISEIVGLGLAIVAAAQTRGQRSPVPRTTSAVGHPARSVGPDPEARVTPLMDPASPIIDATSPATVHATGLIPPLERPLSSTVEPVDPAPTARFARPFLNVAEVRNNQVVKEGRLSPGQRIGRDRAACEFVVNDAGVSRKHLEVRSGLEGWLLLDLGSTNGTFVRQAAGWSRLDRAHQLIEGKLVVRLGRTELIFSEAARGNLSAPERPSALATLQPC